MRLTVYTDYALRVLIYVGLKQGDVSTIGEIAESYDISRNHLMKVVHRLGLLGYLDTVRGKGGGIRLAREPECINLGDVVRCTEEDMALVECFQPGPVKCRIQPECVLRGALQEALRAFMEVLDRYTLADLLKPERHLARLLAIAEGNRYRGLATPSRSR